MSESEPVPAGPFRIQEEQAGPYATVLAIHGDADMRVASALKDRLAVAIDDDELSTLVLDLSATTFVDSMVLGVFLGAMKRLRSRGGSFRVVVPHGDTRRVFEMTLLDRVFEIDESRGDALATIATRDSEAGRGGGGA